MTSVPLPVAHALGEEAILVDVGSDDPSVVLAAAEAIRGLDGVPLADVVPAACTVLVVLRDGCLVSDALVAEVGAAAGRGMRRGRGPSARGPLLEVPVVYDGPDLPSVAEWAGLAVDEVIALHSARTYVAAFVGFAPGFAYLREVDPRIAAPRLDSPRASVPAGSVAIAGGMTAVYPGESPGGWRLVGRTAVSFFDACRDPAALVAPGGRVRFVRDAGAR